MAKSFQPDLKFALIVASLRALKHEDPAPSDLFDALLPILCDGLDTTSEPTLLLELGKMLEVYSLRRLDLRIAENLTSLLQWFSLQSTESPTVLCGITSEAFSTLCASIRSFLPEAERDRFTSITSELKVIFGATDMHTSSSETNLPDSLILPLQTVTALFQAPLSTPSTPRSSKTPDIFGVIVSPPTALLRANGAASTTGLTKTYINNDFRQLRQAPSARQNTSRLPSKHVDDFQETTDTSAIDKESVEFPSLIDES